MHGKTYSKAKKLNIYGSWEETTANKLSNAREPKVCSTLCLIFILQPPL